MYLGNFYSTKIIPLGFNVVAGRIAATIIKTPHTGGFTGHVQLTFTHIYKFNQSVDLHVKSFRMDRHEAFQAFGHNEQSEQENYIEFQFDTVSDDHQHLSGTYHTLIDEGNFVLQQWSAQLA